MDILKKAMIEALEKSLGVVSTAARVSGIARSTHYGWLKDDSEYKQAVEELSEVALDFAESQLHSKIGEGDTTATIFYLKTKGKKRWYVERQEVQNEHSGGVQIVFKKANAEG
jgi:hypothetical protein